MAMVEDFGINGRMEPELLSLLRKLQVSEQVHQPLMCIGVNSVERFSELRGSPFFLWEMQENFGLTETGFAELERALENLDNVDMEEEGGGEAAAAAGNGEKEGGKGGEEEGKGENGKDGGGGAKGGKETETERRKEEGRESKGRRRAGGGKGGDPRKPGKDQLSFVMERGGLKQTYEVMYKAFVVLANKEEKKFEEKLKIVRETPGGFSVKRQPVRNNPFPPHNALTNGPPQPPPGGAAVAAGGKMVTAGRGKSGIDMNEADKNGTPAIYWAAARGHTNIVSALAEHNAMIDNPDPLDGSTPFGAAAFHGHLAAMKVLAAFGADVNKPNSLGITPARSAATQNHLECLRFLVERKAALSMPGRDGRTALGRATELGHTEVVEFLRSKGCQPLRGEDKKKAVESVPKGGPPTKEYVEGENSGWQRERERERQERERLERVRQGAEV